MHQVGFLARLGCLVGTCNRFFTVVLFLLLNLLVVGNVARIGHLALSLRKKGAEHAPDIALSKPGARCGRQLMSAFEMAASRAKIVVFDREPDSTLVGQTACPPSPLLPSDHS